MKTYTLEELKLAQAKKCRIETVTTEGVWRTVEKPQLLEFLFEVTPEYCRIHHADEWKARLPRLREGAEWHRNDFTNEMLEGGCRPLLDGEAIENGDEFLAMLDTDPEWTSYPLSDDTDDWSNASIGHSCGSVFFPHRTRRPVPPEFLHPDDLAKQPEAAPQTDTPETEMTLQEQLIAAHRRIGIEHTEMQVQRDRAIAAEARLAKWESELSKVMPADFKDWWQNSREEWPEVASMVIEGLRKQVEMTDKAAETRVKELEEKRKDISSCRDTACAKLQRRYDTLRNLAVATWRTNYADEAPQWEPLPDIDGIIGQIDNMAAGLAQQVAELKWENAKILSALHLRPIAGAGPVPEGAVRLRGLANGKHWGLSDVPWDDDTHFIDIYPPQQ